MTNTITTIITFVLVASLQNAQRRSETVQQTKLNAIADPCGPDGASAVRRRQRSSDDDLENLRSARAQSSTHGRIAPRVSARRAAADHISACERRARDGPAIAFQSGDQGISNGRSGEALMSLDLSTARIPANAPVCELRDAVGDQLSQKLFGSGRDGDCDALLGDRIQRGTCDLECVLLLVEIVLQQRRDLGGPASVRVGDQRLVDRDLVML